MREEGEHVQLAGRWMEDLMLLWHSLRNCVILCRYFVITSDGVETIVVTDESIGNLMKQLGHLSLGKQGRPGWRSIGLLRFR